MTLTSMDLLVMGTGVLSAESSASSSAATRSRIAEGVPHLIHSKENLSYCQGFGQHNSREGTPSGLGSRSSGACSVSARQPENLYATIIRLFGPLIRVHVWPIRDSNCLRTRRGIAALRPRRERDQSQLAAKSAKPKTMQKKIVPNANHDP